MNKRSSLNFVIIIIAITMFSNNSYSYGNGIGPCNTNHDDYASFIADDLYDAVEICGLCYACDGTVSDGICPEDFGDENRRASCTNHPDLDCVARVRGTVYDELEGNLLSGVKITALSPPGSSIEPIVELTNSEGEYFVEEIAAGRWLFRVEKAGYDTVVEEHIIENKKTNIINFFMPTGSCNADCTNSFGRCSADCDGINGCEYPNLIVRELCDEQEPGTEVVVNETGEFVEKYECCNSNIPITEFRPKAVIHGDMEDLVLRETVVRLNNDIVKVKIAVWE